MTLVEEEEFRSLLEEIDSMDKLTIPGGSCGNTMNAVAVLGGKSVFTYVVSNNEYGSLLQDKINSRGVKSVVKVTEEGLTGTALILTTPDADRTMLTHLGVCREFTKDDIDYEILEESSIFHTTGYELDTPTQKEAVMAAMRHANERGAKISFDIADPFCVSRNIDLIKQLIRDEISIVFGNQDEVTILTGLDDPIEAGKAIIEMGAEIVLVKVGSQGSYSFTKNSMHVIPVFKADKVLDSTGCGDIYAGGFLYGYANGSSVEKSAILRATVQRQIIGVAGVQFELLDMDAIRKKVQEMR